MARRAADLAQCRSFIRVLLFGTEALWLSFVFSGFRPVRHFWGRQSDLFDSPFPFSGSGLLYGLTSSLLIALLTCSWMGSPSTKVVRASCRSHLDCRTLCRARPNDVAQCA
jgi:hypothetical protein